MKLDGAVDAEARVCSCYGQIYENLAMRFLALCKRCLSIESHRHERDPWALPLN